MMNKELAEKIVSSKTSVDRVKELLDCINDRDNVIKHLEDKLKTATTKLEVYEYIHRK